VHDKVIRVVHVALGQRWYDVAVQGMEAHAGPSPMASRRNALLLASELIPAVTRIELDHVPHGCGTVGGPNVYPHSRNVIPGRVTFTVARARRDGPHNALRMRPTRRSVRK